MFKNKLSFQIFCSHTCTLVTKHISCRIPKALYFGKIYKDGIWIYVLWFILGCNRFFCLFKIFAKRLITFFAILVFNEILINIRISHNLQMWTSPFSLSVISWWLLLCILTTSFSNSESVAIATSSEICFFPNLQFCMQYPLIFSLSLTYLSNYFRIFKY